MSDNQNQDDANADLEESTVLNEFELSPEEQAEMAALDAQNEQSNDVHEVGEGDGGSQLFDDIDVNDDPLNPEHGEHNDNAGDNNPKPDAGDGGSDDADPSDDAGSDNSDQGNNDQDFEPPKDYSEAFEELDQQKQEADGKVQDTLDQLNELSAKFDEGEIGQGQYDHQRLMLTRQLGQQEKDVERIQSQHDGLKKQADQEVQDYQEKVTQQWVTGLHSFLDAPENQLIKTNPNVAQKFDQILQGLNTAGLLNGLTQSQVLSTVRTNLAIHYPDLNNAVVAPKSQGKPPKPTHENTNVPLSLANQQTLEAPDLTNPFAYIHKLNGIEYEQAIEKLSEEQLEQFYS